MNILITGASSSGATTLGQALATNLSASHLDTDDYFWLPTKPPYTTKRDPGEKLSLLLADLNQRAVTVVSGSVMKWGEPIESAFDLIVFLYLDSSIRMQRLHDREMARFGKVNPEFLEWASQYDNPSFSGRSLAHHNDWLASRDSHVLRLEGDLTVEQRVDAVTAELNRLNLVTTQAQLYNSN
jgi:uridine kinase